MILQAQHKHQEAPLQQNINLVQPKNVSAHEKSQPLEIFNHLLQSSSVLISMKKSQEIKDKLKEIEKKVLSSYSEEPSTYIYHLSANSQNETRNLLQQIIGLQSDIIVSKIHSGAIKLRQRQLISDIKKDINNKITDMKRSLMSLSAIQKKASSQFENIVEFKKKSYWLEPNQKRQHVRSFLTKMRRIHSEQKKKLETSLKQREQILRVSMQKQIKQKQTLKKELYAKQIQKQIQWRKDRQKMNQLSQKKKEEIASLLQKLSPQKPIYIKKEEEFIKNVIEPLEQERQKKLEEIKQSHHPYDPEQFQQHVQRYSEYKQSLQEQRRKKQEEEQEMNNKLEQELKELYHNRFHKNIGSRFENSQKTIKIQTKKKVKQYVQTIFEQHKPSIDPQQRKLVKQRILDLQLLQDKSKIKVVKQDGSIALQQKPQFNHRKIGVGYLQQLREYNEGKPRKQERSSSLMDLSSTRQKPIDYLRQSRPNVKLKQTMSGWKQIVDDPSYSPRDKFESIMDRANVMEEKAHQKQIEMKSYKKGQKALAIKQQMDKFYIESVAAKMVLLKDVILQDKVK